MAVFLFRGKYCPSHYYACDRVSGCYNYLERCDGKLDCSDGSDEENCEDLDCGDGLRKCHIGPCAQSRDLCCPIRNGTCVEPNFNASTDEKDYTLIFAIGKNLYSLSLARNETQLLYKDEHREITALAYSAQERVVFWAAKSHVYNTSLIWKRNYGKPLGHLPGHCTARIMIFDWITRNFYFVCEGSTEIIVCQPRASDDYMLCWNLITADLWEITWLATNPIVGVMFFGGSAQESFEIFEVDIGGSYKKRIYQGIADIPKCHLNIKRNEILILDVNGNGALSSLNLSDGTARQTASNFMGNRTVANTLATDVAILQDAQGSFALFFWQNRTVATQKSIDLMPQSEVFIVIEPDAQPFGENRCKDFGCEQICLLASSGPFCTCSYSEELMEDKRSCGSITHRTNYDRHYYSYNDATETDDEAKSEIPETSSEMPRPHFSTENATDSETRNDYLIHTFYIAAIVLSVSCGAALSSYLHSRKKFYKTQTALGMTSTVVNLTTELSPMAQSVSLCPALDPSVELNVGSRAVADI